MIFRNLEKRVERLEDDIDDDKNDTSVSEYTPDLTEEDYELLDEMFGRDVVHGVGDDTSN